MRRKKPSHARRQGRRVVDQDKCAASFPRRGRMRWVKVGILTHKPEKVCLQLRDSAGLVLIADSPASPLWLSHPGVEPPQPHRLNVRSIVLDVKGVKWNDRVNGLDQSGLSAGKSATWFRPASLAAYSERSARLMRSSNAMSGLSKEDTPILMVIRIVS